MTVAAPVGLRAADPWSDPGPLRCPVCRGGLRAMDGGFACEAAGCGARLAVRDGLVRARDVMTGDNRIAADFYNGPRWPRVRVWERLFWLVNGGERRARMAALHHLPTSSPDVRLLDVAIGDGVYAGWLPGGWTIFGVDVSEVQLLACLRRNGDRDLRLVLGEAEDLPFGDRQFDAVLSNGAFNHFRDPERALGEMVRVARPGAPVVVADERPDFLDIGHRLGVPALDRWIAARIMAMGDDFADVVERHRSLDVAAIGRRVLKDSRYEVIWRGLGYRLVGLAP